MVPLEAPRWEGKEEPGRQGEGKQGHGHTRDLVRTDQDPKRELGYRKKAADSIMILSHSLQIERERKRQVLTGLTRQKVSRRRLGRLSQLQCAVCRDRHPAAAQVSAQGAADTLQPRFLATSLRSDCSPSLFYWLSPSVQEETNLCTVTPLGDKSE